MIEIEITREMYNVAWAKSRDMGKLKKSITQGDGNIAGFIGEALAHSVIGGIIANTKDYDIITENSLYIDVKTKRCKSEPLPHYEASVAAYNTVQLCDYYSFVRVEYINNEYTRGWYLGHMSKSEYYQKAKKLYAGDRDGDNHFKVKSNCYNVPISDLSLDFSVFKKV